MAEEALSAIGLSVAVDLHTNNNTTTRSGLNENSSTESNARSVGGVSIDLQCPTAPQLRLKLPVLSSSSSETEGEDTQPGGDTANGSGANNAGGGDSARPASPPPNCAICLGRCKNKCFTDSCMHQFCFKCLCEWSKVKPECPLCKQTFKSIIHNVKSLDQFEEYHVQPPTVQIPHRPTIEVTYGQLPYIVDGVVINGRNDYEIVGNWDGPRAAHRGIVRAGRTIFYPYTAGAGTGASSSAGGSAGTANSGAQNQFIHRGELLQLYHQEYPEDITTSGTLSQLWRRYIYDRKLFALPVCDITGRFRDSTARFYRDNPAQIHRLMPFIHRDIACLLRNTEHDVERVMERINETLTMLNILSPAFRRRVHPFLGSKTSHFVHELNNFARSPYDMMGYDRAVQYSAFPGVGAVIEFSTSSEEEEVEASVDNAGLAAPVRRARITQSTRDTNPEYRVQLRASNAAGGAAESSAATTTSSSSSSAVTGGGGGEQQTGQSAPMVNLLSFTISTTSEGTEAPGVSVAVSGRGTQSTAINLTTHNRASDLIIDLDDAEVEAVNSSAAGSSGASNAHSSNAAPLNDSIELNTSSSDECEFVLERKPPHLRTPELVSLNSESDSDVVFVDETKVAKREDISNASDEHGELDNNNRTIYDTREGRGSLRLLVKREERELYNVGASTSRGIQSGTRKRTNRSLDTDGKRQLRHRRNTRSSAAHISQTKKKKKKTDSDNINFEEETSVQTTTTTTTENCGSDSSDIDDSSDDDWNNIQSNTVKEFEPRQWFQQQQHKPKKSKRSKLVRRKAKTFKAATAAKRAATAAKRAATAAKRATRSTASKQSQTKNKQKQRVKASVAQSDTEVYESANADGGGSDNGSADSDDDDGLCLYNLMKRLKRKEEQEEDTETSLFKPLEKPTADSSADEQMHGNEEQPASAATTKQQPQRQRQTRRSNSTAADETEQNKPRSKRNNRNRIKESAKRRGYKNRKADERTMHADEEQASTSASAAAAAALGALPAALDEIRTVTPPPNNLMVATTSGSIEETAALSATPTTIRSLSRASLHSDDARTSTSETTSISTASTASLSSAATTTTSTCSSRSFTSAAEESDSNDAAAVATQDAHVVSTQNGVNIFNLNSSLEQMFHTNQSNESWPSVAGEAAAATATLGVPADTTTIINIPTATTEMEVETTPSTQQVDEEQQADSTNNAMEVSANAADVDDVAEVASTLADFAYNDTRLSLYDFLNVNTEASTDEEDVFGGGGGDDDE